MLEVVFVLSKKDPKIISIYKHLYQYMKYMSVCKYYYINT